MDEKIYKITLADGTVIENLKMNGNNFISLLPVTEDMFAYNCSCVTINDGENDVVHENMELVQITEPETGVYWFVLRDISAQELAQMKMQSDIEYIAMMSGVEL